MFFIQTRWYSGNFLVLFFSIAFYFVTLFFITSFVPLDFNFYFVSGSSCSAIAVQMFIALTVVWLLSRCGCVS